MSEFTRKCPDCGKMHDTGFQNMITGEMVERFEKCDVCTRKEWFGARLTLKEQVILKEDIDLLDL